MPALDRRPCSSAKPAGRRRRRPAAAPTPAPRTDARPGTIVVTNQRSEPATAPPRSAGSRPARTTEDLPEPDGPTTVRNRPSGPGAGELGDEPVDEAVAAEEVGGVGLLERPQALVRVPPAAVARRTRPGHGVSAARRPGRACEAGGGELGGRREAAPRRRRRRASRVEHIGAHVGRTAPHDAGRRALRRTGGYGAPTQLAELEAHRPVSSAAWCVGAASYARPKSPRKAALSASRRTSSPVSRGGPRRPVAMASARRPRRRAERLGHRLACQQLGRACRRGRSASRGMRPRLPPVVVQRDDVRMLEAGHRWASVSKRRMNSGRQRAARIVLIATSRPTDGWRQARPRRGRPPDGLDEPVAAQRLAARQPGERRVLVEDPALQRRSSRGGSRPSSSPRRLRYSWNTRNASAWRPHR